MEVASQLLLSHGMFIKFENTPQKALWFSSLFDAENTNKCKNLESNILFFLRVETDKAGWAELGGLFNW